MEFTKHFDKGFGGLFDSEEISKHIEEVQGRYKVRGRKYRFRGGDLSAGTEEQKVHKCLLEYGEKMRSYRGLRGGNESGGESSQDDAGGKGLFKKGRSKLTEFDKQVRAERVAGQRRAVLILLCTKFPLQLLCLTLRHQCRSHHDLLVVAC